MVVRRKIPDEATVSLESHEMCAPRRLPPGSEIFCLEGVLWITGQGDMEDHFLEAGDRLCRHRWPPRPIIYAIGHCAFELLQGDKRSVIARLLGRALAFLS